MKKKPAVLVMDAVFESCGEAQILRVLHKLATRKPPVRRAEKWLKVLMGRLGGKIEYRWKKFSHRSISGIRASIFLVRRDATADTILVYVRRYHDLSDRGKLHRLGV